MPRVEYRLTYYKKNTNPHSGKHLDLTYPETTIREAGKLLNEGNEVQIDKVYYDEKGFIESYEQLAFLY